MWLLAARQPRFPLPLWERDPRGGERARAGEGIILSSFMWALPLTGSPAIAGRPVETPGRGERRAAKRL